MCPTTLHYTTLHYTTLHYSGTGPKCCVLLVKPNKKNYTRPHAVFLHPPIMGFVGGVNAKWLELASLAAAEIMGWGATGGRLRFAINQFLACKKRNRTRWQHLQLWFGGSTGLWRNLTKACEVLLAQPKCGAQLQTRLGHLHPIALNILPQALYLGDLYVQIHRWKYTINNR